MAVPLVYNCLNKQSLPPPISHTSPPPSALLCLVIWCWNMYLRIFNKLCICYLLMALSTAGPAPADRVTEGLREIANRQNWRQRWWRDKREKETSPKRVSVVPRGGGRTEWCHQSLCSLPPPHGGCFMSHPKTDCDAFRNTAARWLNLLARLVLVELIQLFIRQVLYPSQRARAIR